MHEGMNGGFDNTSKMRERIEYETGELEKLTKDFVLENTKITNELYDEKYRAEWYMLPTKAKEHGIVDYIVGVDCTIDEII
jgi:ATP-dependent protease ClpP protease subunit